LYKQKINITKHNMGRAYEFRKGRKMKRWAQMSKAFTKIGKDIVMAVKAGGPDPATNSRLRVCIQNGKGVNMPKDNIDGAIKRAQGKDEKDLQEIVYEGYAPHGVAVMVETATDNPNRTVADLRVIFSRNAGAMGTSGSVGFMFERKSVFKFPASGQNVEDLELELIDYGAEEVFEDEGEITIIADYTDFGTMQKALEERKINITSSELQRIPTTTKELSEEEYNEVETFLELLDENEDVQSVFHSAQ
jgi:YebC/PmpR family DNA-binding regulatory protein